MIVGFNHNVSYKGVGFHVQTEDSGVKSPQLVTLLYHGGTIIASKKTVYEDILKVDNLSQVVEDLAKEQHKNMLRSLTQGDFDERIVRYGIPIEGAVVAEPEESVAEQLPEPKPEPPEEVTSVAPVPPEPEPVPEPAEAEPVVAVETAPVKIVEEPVVDKFRKPNKKQEANLDDLIFAYLSGADQC